MARLTSVKITARHIVVRARTKGHETASASNPGGDGRSSSARQRGRRMVEGRWKRRTQDITQAKMDPPAAHIQ
jgi:hypothetical protein